MSRPAKASALSFPQLFELWWQFTARAIEVRHRGSFLGALWTVLNPLLMLGLYVTVFGLIIKNRFNVVPNETSVDFALGVFAGLVPFHLFAEAAGISPGLITNNPNLVKKVVFPLEILPLSNLCALIFHAGVSLALLLGATAVLSHVPSLMSLAWLPIIWIPHILLCLGMAWFLSAAGVFFRDIGQVTGFATQLVLYASAMFFSVAAVQSIPGLWAFLRWNPLLHTVDLTRRALLWGLPLHLPSLAYTWAFGVMACVLGYWFFRKTKSGFADVL